MEKLKKKNLNKKLNKIFFKLKNFFNKFYKYFFH